MAEVTPRMVEALTCLLEAPSEGWTPAAFATAFWPDKEWGRSNGPWGLGPDASGRHGGKMLSRLQSLGLVHFDHRHGYYLANLSKAGLKIAQKGAAS